MTPLTIRLTAHAERDLLRIQDDLRQRVKRDMVSLAAGRIPFAQLKKLRGFEPPVWQLTSGRFRALYRRVGAEVVILRVIAKSAQQDVFRGLR